MLRHWSPDFPDKLDEKDLARPGCRQGLFLFYTSIFPCFLK
ncbi:hypothetical protein ADIS_3446 [Lunatimonas lonarensis]|uniref:Uncharacterized protein n=1 Tax=Lunatimonas lonarensis TaxID=1232681 RepID=R7ZQJ0_9BACT|nr:hypothetical protein ADIS_3446 [Lunatimonas lonarensis]